MPQRFPVHVDEPSETRSGIVGAFVRGVRRRLRVSCAGTTVIVVLVVAMTAGAVVGLSVLLGSAATQDATVRPLTAPGSNLGEIPLGSARPGTEQGLDGKTGRGGPGIPGDPGVDGTSEAPVVVGAPTPLATPGAVTDPPGNVAPSAGSDATAVGPADLSSTANGPRTSTKSQASVASAGLKVSRGPTTITNYGSNRCIDVTDGHVGARLQIYDCSPVNTNSHQAWAFYTDKTVRAKVTGQCMTTSSWSSGATITVQNCITGNPLQKFVLNSSHDLTNYSLSAGQAKCVDVVDKGNGNGAKLQLWTCEGTSNQKWR
ncbi:ricin-type beta-trefoil lectin domain protein [Actinoplanes sp. TBRC 11911]|uniref:RICIN domain-containing protein n=1 Tax=Actinoplanes sp. TBRC 11911 TaxID=2729386 RepID=UPI00145F2BE0|nr:RICIN domain-containing protein [Actinoplanes sp. TBRC 11911]NMO55383.1 ricin-type beta-trefoil lectin domain protein [Actinoplanes sp. TBRC 11911]